MIKYNISGYVGRYDVEQFKFPAGEVGVRLSSAPHFGSPFEIKATLKNSDDIMALLLTVDAIRRQSLPSQISATINYVPYARQDRVCSEGESLSIAVMASLINSCKFSCVNVLDPHSDVLAALIDNCYIKTQVSVFRSLKTSWHDTYIVAPDAGAYKKCQMFARSVHAAGVFTCNKDRNVLTGAITGIHCDGDFEGKKLFVLDDICDGGRTFTELSNILRPKAASLELAVTHGIFSKGVGVVADCYDNVYTTTSYHGVGIETDEYTNVYWKEV